MANTPPHRNRPFKHGHQDAAAADEDHVAALSELDDEIRHEINAHRVGAKLRYGMNRPAHFHFSLADDINGGSGQLLTVLKPGLLALEELFSEMDEDGVGAVPLPQARFFLRQKGLKDPDTLQRMFNVLRAESGTEGEDLCLRDGIIHFAEFLSIVYHWHSVVGGVQTMLRQIKDAVPIGTAMQALATAYQPFDPHHEGLPREQLSAFSRTLLPGTELPSEMVDEFYRSDTLLALPLFLYLLYAAVGGEKYPPHRQEQVFGAQCKALPPLRQSPQKRMQKLQKGASPFKAAPTSAEPASLVALENMRTAFTVMETDFGTLDKGRGSVALAELLQVAEHPFQQTANGGSRACSGCFRIGTAYNCPVQGCTVWVCTKCFDNGFRSHQFQPIGQGSRAQKDAVLDVIRTNFNVVDCDATGYLDFFEFVAVAHLVCKVASYRNLMASSGNPASVKFALMSVAAIFDRYDTDRKAALTFEVVQKLMLNEFGEQPKNLREQFDSLCKGRSTVPLSGVFRFIYQIVAPEGKFAQHFPEKPVVEVPVVAVPIGSSSTAQTVSALTIGSVDMSKLKHVKKLGEGGQSTAFLAEYDGMTLVAKYPKPQIPAAAIKEMLRAAALQARVLHKNVMRVYGVHDGEPACILIESCSGGDVNKLWSKYPKSALQKRNPISRPLQWQLMRETAEAFVALQASRPALMHRDLKGANVMLDKDLHVKLGDFDCATDQQRTNTMAGTLGYMAPEVMMERDYDCRCDQFSYAGLLYEITHNTYPYANEVKISADSDYDQDMFKAVTKGVRPVLDPQRCPPKLVELMGLLWSRDPASRPTFAAVIEKLDAMKADFN
eukprot:TRINITY_DN23164_c0_g1_i1.p1 TRINITY_DN23164_c0_g1~~TRINITY_DN23164_c0_g1_i1.p1  ORF type:complete len:835 (+),score=163.49 TRINITY_DN23164_c0_g1_i1:97-2601(+)